MKANTPKLDLKQYHNNDNNNLDRTMRVLIQWYKNVINHVCIKHYWPMTD